MDEDRRYWGVPLEGLFDGSVEFPDDHATQVSSIRPSLIHKTIFRKRLKQNDLTETIPKLQADVEKIMAKPLGGNCQRAAQKRFAQTSKEKLYFMEDRLVEWGIGSIDTAFNGARKFVCRELQEELDGTGLKGMQKTLMKRKLIKALYERELEQRTAAGRE